MQAEISDGVLHLILDSPKTHNAFDLAQAKALVKNLKTKNIKLIVLSAQGRVFCSGGHLKDYAGMKTKAQGLKVNSDIRAALNLFAKYPAPKIAAVTGDCFGGGIELISCCDWILSEPHAFFGLWQRKMELSFGWGGYERLTSRMSSTAIKNWLLSGEVKTASEVMRLGLVNTVTLDMKHEVASLQKKLLSLDNSSYTAIKNKIDKNEVDVFEQLWWTPIHKSRLATF